MSLDARSAQFAPFSALVGYEEKIAEAGRLIDSKIDVDDEIRFILDNKLQKIKEKIHTRPLVTFTYFVPDLKKDGGKYITVSGNVKKIDEYNQIIILVDSTEIHILDIIEIAES